MTQNVWGMQQTLLAFKSKLFGSTELDDMSIYTYQSREANVISVTVTHMADA